MWDSFVSRMNASRLEAINDPRSVHELISEFLTQPDEESAWDAVVILHYRGSREVLEAAASLCDSPCPLERKLGADILGQLGVPDRTFPEECTAVLIELLKHESDDEVLQSICVALGHIGAPEAIAELVELKSHPCVMVRHGVVLGLTGLTEPLAIGTLISMTTDSDELVRDWATFGLGTQLDVDTSEIRDALYARLFDEDEVVRGEGLVGLARRKDPRVFEPLLRELEKYPTAEYGSYSLEAAEELADPRLLPALNLLKQSTYPESDRFDAAIQKCSEKSLEVQS